MTPVPHPTYIDGSKTLVVYSKGDYHKISLLDIVFIEARRSNSILFLANKTAGIPLSSNIGTLVKLLPADQFCQVHRSFILGLHYFEKMNGKKTRVYIHANRTLPVTPAFVQNLLSKLHLIR